jgi:DNA polymerase elongation subunit (family B)
MAPESGLHENVGELDYESMFPNIIIKWNVSYETVGSDHPDDLLGLFRIVAREPLERRLRFKHLRKKLPKDSREWMWCEQRQTSLKGILSCIYGFSGCFANRYGNVTTFEEVNWIARDKLVETVNIARETGFKLIYADTDSIFVKRSGASCGDYEELAKEIASRVGLPITLDHHYKFLILLTRETDSRLEVAKRYFGKLVDGTFNYRGIELRRHDAPPFVKDFQEELMRILFDADSAEEVRRIQLPKAGCSRDVLLRFPLWPLRVLVGMGICLRRSAFHLSGRTGRGFESSEACICAGDRFYMVFCFQ